MQFLNSIFALSKREFQITYRNFSDILSILMFFLLGIIIFVFSIGPKPEIFNQIGIGIIWTLILLSNTLSLRKFYQEDFDDNSIILFHMSGLSYETIVLIKIIVIWVSIQIPFLIVIPLASLLLNVEFTNMKIIYLSFIIGSPIITCITSISGSMNLLNKKNFALGSIIIMIFSIPVIIFAVSLVNSEQNNTKALLNILLGIMFFFFAVTPWICSMSIRVGLQNK